MNAGRPLQFDPETALAQATRLFWEKGFEGTSTAELMEKMNLSKSSLYQTFGSKQNLFNRCIEYYGQMTQDAMLEKFEKAASGKQFLIDFFHQTLLDTDDYPTGCLLVNTACEIGDSNMTVSRLVSHKVKKTQQLMENAIRRAQQEGDISKDKDAKQLSDYLMTNLCGLRVIKQMQYSKAKMQNIIKQILNSLN